MKYKEFLNESNGYKDFGSPSECREYLEQYCSISWKHFVTHGKSGLWRGVGLSSRAGEMTICDPLVKGTRKSVSGNVLTNWLWNSNCDDKGYFNRDISIMSSCDFDHTETFGYPCNVFLQDDALLNATESDFMLSRVDDIFNVKNPKLMTIKAFEDAIVEIVHKISIKLTGYDYSICNDIRDLRNTKWYKTPDKYYKSLKTCWDELSRVLKEMDLLEYRKFINNHISKEITDFFNSNGIGIRDMWNIFNVDINKNSVKSLTVENLYRGLKYDEIWTQSPIVICNGHGIKKIKKYDKI